MAYFQGVGDSSAESTLWLIQEDQGGPLWTRRFAAEAVPDHGPIDLCTGIHHILDALEADHAFLLKGDVFSETLIERWIEYKRKKEVDIVRMRPHPMEFQLYFDA